MIDLTTLPTPQVGEIHLLIGPSGSGKTTALRAISTACDHTTTSAENTLLRQQPLLERWDCDPATAIGYLTAVGLSDPMTWAKTPTEISTGQLHRLAIADALQVQTPWIIIDDFSAPLDRLSARALAWTTGKVLRSYSRSAIIATPHDDVAVDLRPDVITTLGWTDQAHVTLVNVWPACCTVSLEIAYAQGHFNDWVALKHLHYAAGNPATIHSVHVLRHDAITHPAAVAVLSWPDLASSARNLTTDNRYNARRSRYSTQRLNAEVVKLARIVVTPELRGIGLASRLIAHIVEHLNVRYIECSTAMGRHNQFLEAAGFHEVPVIDSAPEAALLDWADAHEIPAHCAIDPATLTDWIDRQSVRVRRETRRRVWHYYHHYIVWRRTRKKLPAHVPPPGDPRWTDAFALAGQRIHARPLYYILGPLDPLTGQLDDTHDPTPAPDDAPNPDACDACADDPPN